MGLDLAALSLVKEASKNAIINHYIVCLIFKLLFLFSEFKQLPKKLWSKH